MTVTAKRRKSKNRAQRRKALRQAARTEAARGERLEARKAGPVVEAESVEAVAALELTAAATITPGVEAAEGQSGQLPRIHADAYNGGAMTVKGYTLPVVVDVQGVDGYGRSLPVLRAHDQNRIVGHGTASGQSGRIALDGMVSAENSDSQEVMTASRNGFPWQASIGLQPTKVERVAKGAKVEANGQTFEGPLYVVRAGKLREVSLVSMGADDTTTASIAAIAAEAATGADDDDGDEGNDSGQNPLMTAGTLSDMRAERERRTALEAMAVKYAKKGGDMQEIEKLHANAVQSGWTAQQLELELLRGQRPNEREGFAGGDMANQGAILEAAIAMAAGMTEYKHRLPDSNRDGSPKFETRQLYAEDVLQRAEDNFGPGGLTLMEAMVKAARRNGHISDTFRVSRELMRAAFAPVEARGASTYDLSGILSNVANKSIKAGFNAVESAWRLVSAIGSVTDFKQITRYALTGDFTYEEVGPGGELKHATAGEESYTNQAKTYGRIFSITRTDLINDDLSAFSRVRDKLGRGAALKLNKVFWTEFLAEVTTFFTSGRGNYQEGADTALDIDSLTAAELLFLDQTDPDGDPLGVEPELLLTPNALRVTASSLTTDTQIRVDGSSSSTKYTTGNPHAGKWRPVSSSYLNNANIPNGSALHWFLMADPMVLALIETVFLNGRQMPFVESADADFDLLAAQLRGYHDFGVSKQEYRAGVRSKGA